MESIDRIKNNIWVLEIGAKKLKEELKTVEAMPSRNLNGFNNIYRTRCLQRIARKMRLNKDALQHNLDLLAHLTK
jgi:hypothetical protein